MGRDVTNSSERRLLEAELHLSRKGLRNALMRLGIWPGSRGTSSATTTPSSAAKHLNPPTAKVRKRRRETSEVVHDLLDRSEPLSFVAVNDTVRQRGYDVCAETTRNDCKAVGYVFAHARHGPDLTAERASARLRWAASLMREHKNFVNISLFGRKILFSDEHQLKGVQRARGSVLPWTGEGTRPTYWVSTPTGCTKVMIWGCCGYNVPLTLRRCPKDGSGPNGGYAHGDYFLHIADALPAILDERPQMVFQYDNSRVHGGPLHGGEVHKKLLALWSGKRVVVPLSKKDRKSLEDDDDEEHRRRSRYAQFSHGYPNDRRMDNWPPNSPDMSPLENIWGELDRRMGNCRCLSENELWERALSSAAHIPLSVSNRYFDDWGKRVEKLVESEGGFTGY